MTPVAAPRGIVVLGCPRSGTTLLRRFLDAHPDIACPPETALLSSAARFLQEQTFPSGIRYGAAAGLAQIGVERATLLDRLRAFVVSFFEAHAAASNARLWAEKTASDAFFVEPIEELLGDRVRYVVLLRHGLDVAVSLAEFVDRLGAYTAELHPYIARERDVFAAMATAWSDVTTALLDLVERRPDAIVVRYESLVADPEAQVAQVFEALQLPPAPTGLPGDQTAGFGDWKTWSRATVDRTSVGRWSREIPRAQLRDLVTRIGPVLERAGYEAVPMPRAVDPASAQRRLELAMRLDAERATHQERLSAADDESTKP